jgi:hypothetical protein
VSTRAPTPTKSVVVELQSPFSRATPPHLAAYLSPVADTASVLGRASGVWATTPRLHNTLAAQEEQEEEQEGEPLTARLQVALPLARATFPCQQEQTTPATRE